MTELRCFKAYDIRGQLGTELNEDIAYRIGRAYAEFLKPQTIVLGGDIRLTSEALKAALSDGIRDAGANVIDIGMVGTEEVYFATSHLKADGGIEVTASHNPIDYNGMKPIREGSRPISSDTGLLDIKRLAEANQFAPVDAAARGGYEKRSVLNEYLDHLLGYIDNEAIRPIKLVMNAGNGAAGHVVDAIETRFADLKLPIEIIKIFNEPDGTFPNGIPNPILHENRAPTIDAVLAHGADMGIAWDGDFDRCFLVDEKGQFIEGYYIVGLLAEAFLLKNPGAKIVHDPRLTWNTIDVVTRGGGQAIQSKTGHAFIKERMRAEDAVYGGEMSAHHYFRDFFYCDSGMIPWLLVMELITRSGKPLSALVNDMVMAYPSPGELNRTIADPAAAIKRVREHYQADALVIDETDGISMEFPQWRFNLRMSNTEPVVRLNLETRGDSVLLAKHEKALLSLLN
ncbi:MAG: phosphomannomutase CpsG [Porticoccaceae bacterium]|jgi:phosphomannomutase|nr:MAG: phosphomannomutase [SAR92 bacterium BACL16 MAG-120322-bin99]MDP4653760.1 phosphomannomutase CpsG [Alphaproteobacteria bacterium]MDP4744680.1 phosphomannomutase CpsG [Porticoccaceae bacterium]MDP4753137.1 phosphomannomutase CpsG [Porticoccaceae bacterium]MDP5050870.1 phosphomannomutase CpsG [Porticoccaceae bacterium]